MNDTDDWDDTPVPIRRRPDGMHVISARVPARLAMAANRRADQTGGRLSDVVRDAVDAYLAPISITLAVAHSDRIRVSGGHGWLPATFSGNTVVSETQYLYVPPKAARRWATSYTCAHSAIESSTTPRPANRTASAGRP